MSRHQNVIPLPEERMSMPNTTRALREGGFLPRAFEMVAGENPQLACSFFAEAIRRTAERIRRDPNWRPVHRSVLWQVSTLAAIPALRHLDARWALTEGDRWFKRRALPRLEGSEVRRWVEGPIVYPNPSRLGGYYEALEIMLEALGGAKALFVNGRERDLRRDTIRQLKHTAEMEALLSEHQPGDFLVVPSQAGRKYQKAPADMARLHYDEEEFCLGLLAEVSRRLTHPDALLFGMPLNQICAGDEVVNPRLCRDGFKSVPYLAYRQSVTWLGFVTKVDEVPASGVPTGFNPYI